MQNKPNFLDALMNVTSLITADYENIANCKLCENKANTKPIKANLLNAQMNVNKVLTKDYRNKPPLTAMAKQTQSNPISNGSSKDQGKGPSLDFMQTKAKIEDAKNFKKI